MRGWAARDRFCARRERGDEWDFRAEGARGLGGGRSNARSDPVPLRFDGFVGGLQRDRSGCCFQNLLAEDSSKGPPPDLP